MFLNRPDGLASFTVEDVEEGLLGRLRHRLDRAPVDGDVAKDRRGGNIHVPYAVMHELVMPLALAGLQIDGDKTLAEEAVAGAIAAVVIPGGQFDGAGDEA